MQSRELKDPFEVKLVVTLRRGLRLVLVCVGVTSRRTYGFICIEGSIVTKEPFWLKGIGRSKDWEVKQTLLRWGCCVTLYLFCSFIENLFVVKYCTRLKSTFGIRALLASGGHLCGQGFGLGL
jgi:hypothetical protein